jgi:hypothetical protein
MRYPSTTHTTTLAAAKAAMGEQCRIWPVADGLGFGNSGRLRGRSVS